MEVLIGVLTAIILLLLLVFVIILFLNRRQKLQSSPTVLKNPFGFAINMKVKETTFLTDGDDRSIARLTICRVFF